MSTDIISSQLSLENFELKVLSTNQPAKFSLAYVGRAYTRFREDSIAAGREAEKK